jgi:hypothetical protein
MVVTKTQCGESQGAGTWWLAAAAVALWIIYFAIAYAPTGAPFIYAEL